MIHIENYMYIRVTQGHKEGAMSHPRIYTRGTGPGVSNESRPGQCLKTDDEEILLSYITCGQNHTLPTEKQKAETNEHVSMPSLSGSDALSKWQRQGSNKPSIHLELELVQ
jgi:hypothetical protein